VHGRPRPASSGTSDCRSEGQASCCPVARWQAHLQHYDPVARPVTKALTACRDVKGFMHSGPRWPDLSDRHPYLGGQRVDAYTHNVTAYLSLLRCGVAACLWVPFTASPKAAANIRAVVSTAPAGLARVKSLGRWSVTLALPP